MELKSPKTKKKPNSRLETWSKMFRTPLLVLFLLGTSRCDNELSLSLDLSMSNSTFKTTRHRHSRMQPSESDANILNDIKYLRRHLNKEIVNFVMTDVLMDGEVENRVHFNGITAKETYVGSNGNGLRLRQLTDGRHLVQLIYTQNGVIQDCEYLSERKAARNFLKTLRKELKLALDEESYKLTQKETNIVEEEKFYRHFGNVTFRILKNNVKLPPDIASWLDYSKLKMECLKRHEELKYMMENKNKIGETSLTRFRRSVRENFILPGTKWCGAGQLAQEYNELGSDHHEDRCCRAHDNCRVNIGAFKRRFGYFNLRPFTVSHCKCDRRGKRDAMDILRVPGTKWCGKGFSATRYSQLGGYTRTDRCCRVHDLRCPFWIGALENKYGLYNWRVNTLMHCRCDESGSVSEHDARESPSRYTAPIPSETDYLVPANACTPRAR